MTVESMEPGGFVLLITSIMRVFGEIGGYPEGSTFVSRTELSESGVHRPPQAGISGSQAEGADSIVLSGGYEDDRDWGDEVLYTGHGGRDPESGRQTSHQMLLRGNLALALNRKRGLPVRVVRGATHGSLYSPREGYRYDGLFWVVDHFRERGKSGFYVWRFKLQKMDAPVVAPVSGNSDQETPDNPAVRTSTVVTRIIRESALAEQVKKLYDYRCQVCGTRLEGNAGPYAEAAHIQPLGRPHNGPDVLENLLCLCPNHHILFDYGAIAIGPDWTVIGLDVRLTVRPKHHIGERFLQYHRDHYGFDADLT